MAASKSYLHVEQHGIDAVPKAERTKNWFDLFVIYAGLNIALSVLLVGGLLVPALSWGELLFVAVVGNGIVGALIVLMGHMGVDHGFPAAVLSQSTLGHPLGTNLASIALLVSLTGWFAVNAELGAIAMDAVTRSVLGFSSLELMILFLGLANAVVSIIGIESIKWLSRLSVPLRLAVMIWLTVALLTEYPFVHLIDYEPTGDVSVSTGIDWMVSAVVVGIFIAADYARHARSRDDNWVGVMLGIVPAAVFLTGLGALSALATGDWNPVNGIEALGLGAPAMFIIVFSTWTTNDINLYSGGLALTNIVPRLDRWQNTLILSLAGTGIAMLRITEHFTTFLELLGVFFGPLVGIMLADYYLIRKCRLDVKVYPNRNINLISWSVAIVGTLVALFTPEYLIASVVAMFASAVLYWLIMRMLYRERKINVSDA
jgi:putative hydroxymethylpyrimidine transporter CytX